MQFRETQIKGAYLIEPERMEDERGFFARTFCQQEFENMGLNPKYVQCSISYNKKRGTLRGMHYQETPFTEARLVRCTAGSVYDVVIDLRPASPTFTNWWGVELTAANRCGLYVPEGLAHGFVTLEDNTELLYQMSSFYNAESARGVRWDDPRFGIRWPESVRVISDRDRSYPDFKS